MSENVYLNFTEKTLERSAYALIWVKGLHDLLSMDNLLVNSDVAVATILSPLNSLNHLLHPPTFDIGLRIRKVSMKYFFLMLILIKIALSVYYEIQNPPKQ